MSLLPLDEALHLCRQPAPISLFTIYYGCSTLICLILISLWLEDWVSLCEFRALDLPLSFPEMCRNPHCHPAPKPAQSEGKKKKKYEGFSHHVHEFFFREEKNQSWKSGEQTGSYQDQKRDLSSMFLATGDASSPPLPSELPKQASHLANKNKSQKDLLREELNTHCKS